MQVECEATPSFWDYHIDVFVSLPLLHVPWYIANIVVQHLFPLFVLCSRRSLPLC
jgi:hypothetical protein